MFRPETWNVGLCRHKSAPLLAVLLSWLFSLGAFTDEPSFQTRLALIEKELQSQPTNTALLYRAADLCHDKGVKDDEKAVLLAERFLDRLLKIDPANGKAMTLLGSVFTMKGRDAFWPTTQLSLVKEGNRIMDAGVALAPDDPDVRLIRAMNNVHMPGFLGREQIAHDDFEFIHLKIKEKPDRYPPAQLQEIALFHGIALRKFKKNENAVTIWNAGLEVAPEGPFTTQIREELKKIKTSTENRTRSPSNRRGP